MLIFVLFFAFMFALGTSFSLTQKLRRRLAAKAMLDIPNERSMHKVPVPRGGGLAVMVTIMAGMALLTTQEILSVTLPLMGALTLLMLISWIDDKRGVPAGLRLALHLVAAGIGSLALGENAMIFGGFLPPWLDRALMIVGWGWFMNLYNFMDGIDGITSVETISCASASGLFLALFCQEDPYFLILCVLISGACLGFLKLNWHPAKIFLGDVGSVPLGFLIGFLLLKIAASGYLLPALLIPLYYLADSGLTITKRLLRGEKIWQAHREHFYQRATLAAGSPVPVVLLILVANCGFAASALVAAQSPWLGAMLGVGILLLLLFKMNHPARKALS